MNVFIGVYICFHSHHVSNFKQILNNQLAIDILMFWNEYTDFRAINIKGRDIVVLNEITLLAREKRIYIELDNL